MNIVLEYEQMWESKFWLVMGHKFIHECVILVYLLELIAYGVGHVNRLIIELMMLILYCMLVSNDSGPSYDSSVSNSSKSVIFSR
jgi:hypothetical protein